MTERDTLGEARMWLEQLRMSSDREELIGALSEADDETLREAYLLWWRTYSSEVILGNTRTRSVTTKYTAMQAGNAADADVMEYLACQRYVPRAKAVETGQPPIKVLACTVCGVLLWDIDAHYKHAHKEI